MEIRALPFSSSRTFSSTWMETLYLLSSHFLSLLSHQPLATTNVLFSVSMNVPILDFHINGIMQYVVFYVCLLWLTRFSRFILAIATVILYGWITLHCLYITHFYYSFISWWTWTIVINLLWAFMYKYLSACFLWNITRSRIAESYGNSMINLLRSSLLVTSLATYLLHSHW